MDKPTIPEPEANSLKRKRLHNAGDLNAHSGRVRKPVDKPRDSEVIAQETRAYLARGGQITHIERGTSGYTAPPSFVIKSRTDTRSR